MALWVVERTWLSWEKQGWGARLRDGEVKERSQGWAGRVSQQMRLAGRWWRMVRVWVKRPDS